MQVLMEHPVFRKGLLPFFFFGLKCILFVSHGQDRNHTGVLSCQHTLLLLKASVAPGPQSNLHLFAIMLALLSLVL